MPFAQLGSDIDGEDANDSSGYSVSLSADGSIVAIGTPYNDGNGNNAGHVRLYAWNGSAWVQRGSDIDGEAAGDSSGCRVSLSADGSIVAIGANGNDGNGSFSGHVRLFEWNSGTSSWNQLGLDIDGEAEEDTSGSSVSLSGDGSIVAIGASGNDGNGSFSGHVRLFEWNSGTSSWNQLGLDIDGEAAGDSSGISVSLSADGSIVAIGASGNAGNGSSSGHVRLFEWNSGTSSWNQLGLDIDGEAEGDSSGYSVSLSADGSIVAIGAYGNDGNGSFSGHVRLFEWNSGTSSWNQLGLDIDGEAEGDLSGISVSLSADGSIVAIGATGNDGNGSFSGHVRLFEWNSGTSSWNQLGLDIDGEAEGDSSGYSVSLSADGSIVAIGAAGNEGTVAGQVRIFDLEDPTISISSDVTSLKAGETTTLTFTLSESSTDFIASDVTATGGELSGFSGSGTSYSATFTPTADSTTNGVITVASSKFSDAAGNTNNDGSDSNNTVTLSVDTVRPTIAISSDATSLKAGETATLTFTLSESSSDFVAADITATGGELSGFSGSGTSYSATFTPTADSTTNGVITVASSKFSDAAGNTNNDGSDSNNSVTLSVDTVRPTIAISSDITSLKAGETATLTFTLSESSTDFIAADVTATGGELSGFSGSGTSYSATFTPTADSTTNGVISVASTKFSNDAGNTNNDGSDSNNTVTLSVDTVRPTIAISSDVTSLKAGETATLTFTLSESSTDFIAADVTATGGELSGFSGSGTSYSATFTPTADSTTNGVISVASTKFSNDAGNTNNDGSDSNNTVTLSVDTVRPTIAIGSDATSLKAGETATLTFTLSESSSDFVAADVTATGGELSSFSGSGSAYTATFTPTADSTTNGVISVASSKFSDAAGNTNNDGSDSNNSVTLSIDTIQEPKDYVLPTTKKTIKGTNKNDKLKGTNKKDLLIGKRGDDKLTGSKGSDVLQGNGGKDVLKGSKGKDYLDGSKGNDVLIGGKGADVFQISKGNNLVKDFRIKQGDRIALDKKGKYSIVDDPDGVLVLASAKKQLFLEGIDYDDVITAGVDLFVQPI